VAELPYEIFSLGTISLQSGETLPNAHLAYATYGNLNETKDNVIVFPTHYAGTHTSNARIIGKGRALDTDRFFVVVPNLFGNGLSSSPSNTPPPHGGPLFPKITITDNIRSQHHLLSEKYGIKKIALVVGWSMGAQQAYHWGVMFPDMVERILPSCGSAQTSPHNWVFLEGVKAAFTADLDWKEGWYSPLEPPGRGLRAFGRVYAGWAYSQAFFREKLYTKLGFSTPEDLLQYWEQDHMTWDANNLLSMLWTWQNSNIANTSGAFKGDLGMALRSISAKVIVMPCCTDLYFHFEDSKREVEEMPQAEYREFRSLWGHCAGAPGRSVEDMEFFEKAIRDLLER